jgi:putative FmdB family regulatory protein
VPTYTYTCTACNDVIEKRQSFSDSPLTTCEQCGGTLRKVIHPVGIVFKGSGWYITDSRASTSSANGPAASKSETKSAEATPSTSAGADSSGSTSSTSTPTTSSTPTAGSSSSGSSEV